VLLSEEHIMNKTENTNQEFSSLNNKNSYSPFNDLLQQEFLSTLVPRNMNRILKIIEKHLLQEQKAEEYILHANYRLSLISCYLSFIIQIVSILGALAAIVIICHYAEALPSRLYYLIPFVSMYFIGRKSKNNKTKYTS